MNDAINLLPLSSYLSTTLQVKELLSALDQLKAAYFQKKQTFVTTLEQEIPYPLSSIIENLTKMHNVNLADASQTETFFTQLEQAIEQMPRLTLTISFHPTLALIKELNRWTTDQLKAAVVLDFEVDETLVGGAKFAYKGKILDHTLKKQVEIMMQPKAAADKQQING